MPSMFPPNLFEGLCNTFRTSIVRVLGRLYHLSGKQQKFMHLSIWDKVHVRVRVRVPGFLI